MQYGTASGHLKTVPRRWSQRVYGSRMQRGSRWKKLVPRTLRTNNFHGSGEREEEAGFSVQGELDEACAQQQSSLRWALLDGRWTMVMPSPLPVPGQLNMCTGKFCAIQNSRGPGLLWCDLHVNVMPFQLCHAWPPTIKYGPWEKSTASLDAHANEEEQLVARMRSNVDSIRASYHAMHIKSRSASSYPLVLCCISTIWKQFPHKGFQQPVLHAVLEDRAC